jgi:hypothetical protein
MHLAESPVKANLKGTCTAGIGPDLTGYPHLVYAPRQWGDGVRVGSNGAPIEAIAADAMSGSIMRVACVHGVTVFEALDALCYARANGLI